MNLRSCRRGIAALLVVPFVGVSAQTAGNLGRGAQAARACLACHSLSPGRNLTRPSLWRVVGRKAGTAEGFGRYSAALKASGLKWDEQRLDAGLKGPAALVPGNSVGFVGIADAKAGADLIAYLEAVSAGRIAPPADSFREVGTLGAMGIPLTLLIDREGREVGRNLGRATWDDPKVVQTIRGYLPTEKKS